jgi:phage-related tail protein
MHQGLGMENKQFYQKLVERVDLLEKLREKDVEEMHALAEALKANTEAINKLVEATTDIINAWSDAKGAANVLGVVSKATKILIPIGLFFGATFYFIKYGSWPPK